MHDTLGEMLANRRMEVVLPHVRGRLLDLGCGDNKLVRRYENGVGVDVYPWRGADLVVPDSSALQWEAETFDTITIIAALNHMPNRVSVLRECRRILRRDGQIIVTMLTPLTSRVWHWLRGHRDADQRERGMKPGEVYGFMPSELIELFASCGFRLASQERFMCGLNRLYVFKPAHIAYAAQIDRKKAS